MGSSERTHREAWLGQVDSEGDNRHVAILTAMKALPSVVGLRLTIERAGESMSYIMVDIESDGPIPGDYSMICFGAIVVDHSLDKTFYARLRPISESWIPEALSVSGFSREETLEFDDPKTVMEDFASWIETSSRGRPMFISDNNGFDWQFINWYFHRFTGDNPFGHSSTNLGSLYKGLVKDTFENFKHLRVTEHTHHPLDDARGNAEALLRMKDQGLKISLE